MASMVNGIVMEIDQEDLESLVAREKGYDLVRILIADWKDVISNKPHLEIKIAYTFVAPYELRNCVIYTSTEYYPVRGYLEAVQEGAFEYGEEFANFWNATTYLADGTTNIEKWDKHSFEGILCTKQNIA